MRILWLHEAHFSGKQRSLLELYLNKSGIDPANIFFVSIHSKVQNLWVRKAKTKNKWICNSEKGNDFFKALDYYIDMVKCDLIIINDAATLGFITGYISLDLCRGSIYKYNNIPCPVVDRVTKVHQVKYAPWILLQDLGKIRRWFNKEKRHEPKFNYSVIRSVRDIDSCLSFLNSCFITSTDIETAADFITCVGFTGLHISGAVHSYVFPFYNPLKENNCHWEDAEDEITAWKAVREICANESIKVLQNGAYDSAYFIKYRIMLRNYFALYYE